jgi:hypothetical protein
MSKIVIVTESESKQTSQAFKRTCFLATCIRADLQTISLDHTNALDLEQKARGSTPSRYDCSGRGNWGNREVTNNGIAPHGQQGARGRSTKNSAA